MANHTSQHILGTASNLLGFCLFVLTALHITNQTESHFIDELTAFISVLLTLSCILSFISIKSSNINKEQKFESTANYLFMGSLLGILIIILLITFNFIH